MKLIVLFCRESRRDEPMDFVNHGFWQDKAL